MLTIPGWVVEIGQAAVVLSTYGAVQIAVLDSSWHRITSASGNLSCPGRNFTAIDFVVNTAAA